MKEKPPINQSKWQKNKLPKNGFPTRNYKIIPFKMGFWTRLIFLFTNKASIVIETDNQTNETISKGCFLD